MKVGDELIVGEVCRDGRVRPRCEPIRPRLWRIVHLTEDRVYLAGASATDIDTRYSIPRPSKDRP